jgi:hypothetical protein
MNLQKLILSTLLCATSLVSADTAQQYIKAKDIASLPRWEVYTGDESLLDPRTYGAACRQNTPLMYDCECGDESKSEDAMRNALAQTWDTIELRNA